MAQTPSTESTVVIRVVGTNPSWGQEQVPGWPDASPIKDAPGYSLYDLEIGWDATPRVAYLSLYKFSRWQTSFQFLPPTEFTEYWTSSTISSIPIQSTGSADPPSAQVLASLQSRINLVLQRERPTRLVINYSGHGSPNNFWEGALNNSDAQIFLRFVRQKAAGILIVLDFSTNCNVGYFDFVVRHYQYADYIVASEKQVGGFSVDSASFDTWLANAHDRNYSRFWQSSNSLDSAFGALVTARQVVWTTGSPSIIAGHVEQSLGIYKLAEFNGLVSALSQLDSFNPPADLPPQSNDIGTFAYATRDSALIRAFEKFRILYASNRDLVTWTDDSRGFSVVDPGALQSFLASVIALQVQVSSEVVSFGNVELGQFKDSTVTITNSGTDTLKIVGLSSSDTSFAPRPTVRNVAPGQSFQDTIRFMPTTVGPVSGILLIDSNTPTSPNVIGVSGTGTEATTVERIGGTPAVYSLSQNFPNPFNPSTHIPYGIAHRAVVHLKIYNALGQQIASLVNEERGPGFYQIKWNAGELPSGIYLYRLQVGEFVDTKKLILAK